jgi:hypothetical protein
MNLKEIYSLYISKSIPNKLVYSKNDDLFTITFNPVTMIKLGEEGVYQSL